MNYQVEGTNVPKYSFIEYKKNTKSLKDLELCIMLPDGDNPNYTRVSMESTLEKVYNGLSTQHKFNTNVTKDLLAKTVWQSYNWTYRNAEGLADSIPTGLVYAEIDIKESPVQNLIIEKQGKRKGNDFFCKDELIKELKKDLFNFAITFDLLPNLVLATTSYNKGIHLILQVDLENYSDYNLKDNYTEAAQVVIDKVNHLLNELGYTFNKEPLKCDTATTDYTRCANLAYDPAPFVNFEAKIGIISDSEIAAKIENKTNFSSTNTNDINIPFEPLTVNYTPSELEKQLIFAVNVIHKKGFKFTEGERNPFIFELSCFCNVLGIKQVDLSNFCESNFFDPNKNTSEDLKEFRQIPPRVYSDYKKDHATKHHYYNPDLCLYEKLLKARKEEIQPLVIDGYLSDNLTLKEDEPNNKIISFTGSGKTELCRNMIIQTKGIRIFICDMNPAKDSLLSKFDKEPDHIKHKVIECKGSTKRTAHRNQIYIKEEIRNRNNDCILICNFNAAPDILTVLMELNLSIDLLITDEIHNIIEHQSFRYKHCLSTLELQKKAKQVIELTGTEPIVYDKLKDRLKLPKSNTIYTEAKNKRKAQVKVIEYKEGFDPAQTAAALLERQEKTKVLILNNKTALITLALMLNEQGIPLNEIAVISSDFNNSKFIDTLVKDAGANDPEKIKEYKAAIFELRKNCLITTKSIIDGEKIPDNVKYVLGTKYIAASLNIYNKNNKKFEIHYFESIAAEHAMNPFTFIQGVNRFRDTKEPDTYIHYIKRNVGTFKSFEQIENETKFLLNEIARVNNLEPDTPTVITQVKVKNTNLNSFIQCTEIQTPSGETLYSYSINYLKIAYIAQENLNKTAATVDEFINVCNLIDTGLEYTKVETTPAPPPIKTKWNIKEIRKRNEDLLKKTIFETDNFTAENLVKFTVNAMIHLSHPTAASVENSSYKDSTILKDLRKKEYNLNDPEKIIYNLLQSLTKQNLFAEIVKYIDGSNNTITPQYALKLIEQSTHNKQKSYKARQLQQVVFNEIGADHLPPHLKAQLYHINEILIQVLELQKTSEKNKLIDIHEHLMKTAANSLRFFAINTRQKLADWMNAKFKTEKPRTAKVRYWLIKGLANAADIFHQYVDEDEKAKAKFEKIVNDYLAKAKKVFCVITFSDGSDYYIYKLKEPDPSQITETHTKNRFTGSNTDWIPPN